MLKPRSLFTVYLAIPVSVMSMFVSAQDDSGINGANFAEIEKITISGSRRDAIIQDLNTSVSAITEKQIQQQGIDNLYGILRSVPGATLSQPRRNRATINIRGINTDIGETQLTQDPVGLHLNAMPITSSYAEVLQPDLSLYDINRVEVLRGPQGTLYGAGNIAGTVRIITNQPEFNHFSASARVDYSDIDYGGLRQRHDLMLNIPLVDDQLAMRLVASHRDEEGWIENMQLGIDNSYSETNLRAVLGWQPTEKLHITFETMFIDSKPIDGDSWDPETGKFMRKTAISENRKYDMQVYNLTIEYLLANAMTAVSSTNKRTSSANWSSDIGEFGDIGELINDSVLDSDNLSQEFRLVSSNKGDLQWVAGVYYQGYELTGPFNLQILGLKDFFNMIVPGLVQSDAFNVAKFTTDTEELAIFADTEFAIAENWSLSLGARYFETDAKISQTDGQVFDFEQLALIDLKDFDNQVGDKGVMWRSALSFKPNRDQHYYLNFSKGIRAAQVNPNIGPSQVDPNDVVIAPSYQSDTLYSVELGVKLNWLRDAAQTNIAIYHLSWRDIQIDALRQSDNLNYIANAGDATANGVELELRAILNDHIETYLAVSWQDAKIDKITQQQSFLSGAKEGDRLPGAADITASAGVTTSWQLKNGYRLSASIDANYVDESTNRFSNFSATGTENLDFAINDSYCLVNARLTLALNKATATFYVENLTNNDNIILNTGATERNPAVSLQPRTIGIRINYNF